MGPSPVRPLTAGPSPRALGGCAFLVLLLVLSLRSPVPGIVGTVPLPSAGGLAQGTTPMPHGLPSPGDLPSADRPAPRAPSGPLSAARAASAPSSPWTEVGSLPARSFAMSVDDPATGYDLVFGGNGTNGYLGDTWELTYDDANTVFYSGAWADWTPVATPTAPSPRMAGAMAYDAFDGTAVLFGGYDGSYLGDTWVYNAGLWTEIHPGVSPPARAFASMTWDNQRDEIVLFGGKDSAGPLNDTWGYANGSWFQLHPVHAPSPRYGAAMAYDGIAKYDLLFGGTNGSAETWEFSGGNWTQAIPNDSPPGREFASMVYNGGSPEIYLLAGYDGSPLSDVWEWQSGNWGCGDCPGANLPPTYGALVSDYPLGTPPLLATGVSAGNETWWYHGGWDEFFPSNRPPPYGGSFLTYDPLTQQSVFEGGLVPGGYWTDTWALAGENWTELSYNAPNNLARQSGAMAWDGADQYLLYFGGYDGYELNSTYKFTGTTWAQVGTNYGPSPRLDAGLVYDPVDGYVLLFGGTSSANGLTDLNDTWTYVGGTWTNITATAGPAPPVRFDPMMAWDARDDEVVMFGGQGPQFLNDTWTFVHGKWHQVHPSVSPPARDSAGFSYDTATGMAYLVGGYNGAWLADLWAYAAGSWTEITPDAPFGPAGNVLSTYDVSQNHLVIYGGDSDEISYPTGGLQRLWVWSPQAASFTAGATANATDVDGSPPIVFTGTANGGVPPYTATWAFGDGGKASSLVATHAYAAPGDYVARLYVNDSVGNSAEQAVNITVNALLQVAPSATPSRVTVGVPVVLSAGATGGAAPLNLSWDFGDGSGAGFGANVRHTFPAIGNYTVTLVVEDAIGAVARATLAVQVVSGPLALTAFGLPSVGIAPLTVDFTSGLQGGVPPYALLWEFGDGATSQYADPTHTYNRTGTVEVTLYASDSVGQLRTHFLNITVLSSTPLSVSPIETPTSGGAPLSVSFSASVQGGSQTGYEYLWSFGDGSVGTLASESHTYEEPGIYTPTISVNDAAGDEATEALPAITVTATSGAPGMQVHANAIPEPGASPTEVGFTASVIGGTPDYSFVWHFGDGSTSTSFAPSHTYPTPGFYNASLNVTDSSVPAQTASTTLQVDVGSPGTGGLSLALAANPQVGFLPLTVTFAAVASGGSGSYPDIVWTFGDGQNGTGPYESHTYDSSGLYTVHAYVTDTLGNTAQAELTVKVVTGSVKVAVSASSTTGAAPLPVAIQAAATGGTGLGYRYAWNFGDRTNGTGADVVHTYNSPGSYVITVTVTDSGGNVGSATLTVNVTSEVRTATTPTFLGLPFAAWYIITPLSIVLGLMALVLILALRRPMLLASKAEDEEEAPPVGELPEWPVQPMTLLETADDAGALTMAQNVPKESLLVFSRLPPDALAAEKGFDPTQVWQLAVSEGENRIRPADLEQLGHLIEKHLAAGKDRAVVLTGVDMLLDATSPKAVRRLLAVARELAQEHNGRVLVALNPKGLAKEDRVNLEEGATVLKH